MGEQPSRVTITLDLADYQAEMKAKDGLIKAQANVIETMRQAASIQAELIALLRKAQA